MKNVLRLLCGWMAIALAACTGDELQQIAPLQKPVGERVISVDAYTPSDDAHTRLDFTEEDDGSLSLAWTEEDAFTAVIGNKEVLFTYDADSEQFTAKVAENIELTDGIVAYYPAYTGEYSTDLSQQTGALNSAKTFMEGTYHAASKSFTFAHSTAILKATFSGLPQDAVVSSIKIGAAPYTISIPPTNGIDLANDGIYIYLPNVAKDENVVFSVSTTAGAVYTATQAVVLDEGIKVGTYYVAPIALTLAACNLPTGSEFNAAIEGFLEENSSLTQIEFIANSVNTDKSNPVGRSNAYMVANGEILEIHTAALQFVFDADCEDMFSGLSTITAIDFGDNFNTANVTNMSWMFYNCSSLKSLDLSSFNTANVTDISYMFYGCSKLNSIDFGDNFNTANVTDMSLMFYGCSSLSSLNLSSFNTANVTDMSLMFYDCSSLTSLNLSSFNTANVTTMSFMFYGCSSLSSLDLSSFNTSKVEEMGWMFQNCYSLPSLDLSSFDFGKVYSFDGMFENLGKNFYSKPIPVCVTQAAREILNNQNTKIDANCAKYVLPCELPNGVAFKEAIRGFLEENSSLTQIQFIANSVNTDKPNQKEIGSSNAYMVANDNVLEIHTASPKFVFNANCVNMFSGLSNITPIDFGDNIDTSKVTIMGGMFRGCYRLTSLDLSSFNFSKVSNFNGMFSDLGRDAATINPIQIYVKDENEKALLESKSTGINGDYAKIVVKQP